ncbi:unnamed protein product [Cyclocybe aegerita]|uniref:Uncharacterized protein n=1 Tax=Cyclocybe aegerita TaxID=1973307 RepID=A0A8S0XQW1_CYCAE|nr:unnamed protein product [Cyclocybe aegerita]
MPLQINGVEAWITVDDKVRVMEYAVDVDEDMGVATCWISGEPGQSFAIRWRDLTDPIASPSSPRGGDYTARDLSGFVMMDGYELGGRVLQARSHASAIFSRIATSPTSCLPLTFSTLPRTAGIGEDWKTLGTISLDVHVVQIGEGNRLHEGYSSYYRRYEGSPLSSATPFSSTEVTSVRKIATFVFKYRPLDVLQYHCIAPITVPFTPLIPRLGNKRRAPDSDSDSDSVSQESEEDDMIPCTPSLIFTESDSDSSQDFGRPLRIRPSRNSYDQQSGYHPQAKRLRFHL